MGNGDDHSLRLRPHALAASGYDAHVTAASLPLGWIETRATKAILLMNVVDLMILIVIGLFAVRGLTRGLFLGIVDLLLFAVALFVAYQLAPVAASPLGRIEGLGTVAAMIGFFTIFLAALGVLGVAARILLGSVSRLGTGSVLGWLNSLLGMALGAVRGVAIVFLVLLAVTAAPLTADSRDAVNAARLPAPIMRAGYSALDQALVWAGIDRGTASFPFDRTPRSQN
ncbi:MAG: CvpA family protein [Thermomicrobiales bacterium]